MKSYHLPTALLVQVAEPRLEGHSARSVHHHRSRPASADDFIIRRIRIVAAILLLKCSILLATTGRVRQSRGERIDRTAVDGQHLERRLNGSRLLMKLTATRCGSAAVLPAGAFAVVATTATTRQAPISHQTCCGHPDELDATRQPLRVSAPPLGRGLVDEHQGRLPGGRATCCTKSSVGQGSHLGCQAALLFDGDDLAVLLVVSGRLVLNAAQARAQPSADSAGMTPAWQRGSP